MDDELKGVKGWLAAFVIIIAAVSPGWSAVQVYQALHTGDAAFLADVPIFATLRNVAWGTVAFAAAIGWFVAYRLLAVRNWTSVRIAIAGVWLASVGTLVIEYLAITWILGLPGDMVLFSAGPQNFIRPFAFGLIWTAYLLKSRRVENTYRGGEEQAEVFE
jgi:hypothetical protein